MWTFTGRWKMGKLPVASEVTVLRWWMRWRSWALVVTVPVAVAVVSASVEAWLPSVIAASVAAAVAAVAAIWIARTTSALEATPVHRGQDLTRAVLTDGRGRLPRAGAITDPLVLGVHPASDLISHGVGVQVARHTPFVPRDASEKLVRSLSGGRGFVLLVGESTAGKTRAAFEAVRQVLADRTVIAPRERSGLAVALALAASQRRVVVWLDDLERYLGADGLTALDVARLVSAPHEVIILATMRAHEYSRFLSRDRGRLPLGTGSGDIAADSQLLRAGADVLEMAKVVRVERRWSHPELVRARTFGQDLRIAAALEHSDRYGIAEYLTAAPLLLEDWRNAWSPGTHPRGAALVLAAVDAERAGHTTPLSEDLLVALHHHYLSARGGPALRPEPLAQALAWASEALHATSSLLIPHEDSRYRAFDYLPAAIEADEATQAIPDQTWRILIEKADAQACYTIGEAALQADRIRDARDAFLRAAQGGNNLALAAYGGCVCYLGAPQRAITITTEAVDLLQAGRGPDHPDTLEARGEHAGCVAVAGNPREAVRLMSSLVEDFRRVLGPAHTRTLRMRMRLAGWIGGAGDHAECISLFAALVDDYHATFGPRHRDTLRARQYYAYRVGIYGDPAQAAQLMAAIAEDRKQVFGDSHMETLAGYQAQAIFMGQAGRAAEAADLLADLIPKVNRAVGPTHSFAFITRGTHAGWAGEAGNPRQAADLYRDILADHVAAEGSNHPKTLDLRSDYAHWVGKAGDPQQARQLLQELVIDSVALRGRGDWLTSSFRHQYANWTGESGHPAEAVRLLRDLTDDLDHRLGADHPDILLVRFDLADWTGQSGDPHDAAQQLDHVLQTQTRILGTDHPDVLKTYHQRAVWIGESGDPAKAAADLSTVVTRRTERLGADHPDTLLSRNVQAAWTAKAGN